MSRDIPGRQIVVHTISPAGIFIADTTPTGLRRAR
jgi:hypothetical protein